MKNQDNIQFEDSLQKLEDLVEQLESGELGLDESLKLFEQGVTLYKNCKEKLSTTEKKLSLLTEQMKEESMDLEK